MGAVKAYKWIAQTADFAEHNIKLFNVMAGIVGGIAGAAGGFRSYKKRAKKNAIS